MMGIAAECYPDDSANKSAACTYRLFRFIAKIHDE